MESKLDRRRGDRIPALERAEGWCRALRDELAAALATRTY